MVIYNVHVLALPQAFAEAAKQTAESFQDEAPFVVKNRLGLPVSVRHSEMFSPIGQQSIDQTVKLQDGETLGMDYSTTTDSDQFSAMISLSGKDYYIQPSKLICTHRLSLVVAMLPTTHYCQHCLVAHTGYSILTVGEVKAQNIDN